MLIVFFWLVLLTEHDVLHLLNVVVAVWGMESAAAWLPDNCTHLVDFLQQTINAFKFPTLVGKFHQQPSFTKSCD